MKICGPRSSAALNAAELLHARRQASAIQEAKKYSIDRIGEINKDLMINWLAKLAADLAKLVPAGYIHAGLSFPQQEQGHVEQEQDPHAGDGLP